METPKIIEGLTILQKYRTDPDGFHTGAEHDQLCAYETDTPVSEEDFNRLIELGWFQPDTNSEKYEDYTNSEVWSCYV